MNEKALAEQLKKEGFGCTYVWEDGLEHTHSRETAHIVLRGEMTLTIPGTCRTYREGERCDVPAGAVHSARIGPKGCRYLIGERPESA